MSGDARKRGRPPDSRKRLELARSILLEILVDEYEVGSKRRKQRGPVRGHSQPMKLHYLAAAEAMGVSASWAQKAWLQFGGKATTEIAQEIVHRLDVQDAVKQRKRVKERLQALALMKVDPGLLMKVDPAKSSR
jgi:hypothetical protein